MRNHFVDVGGKIRRVILFNRLLLAGFWARYQRVQTFLLVCFICISQANGTRQEIEETLSKLRLVEKQIAQHKMAAAKPPSEKNSGKDKHVPSDAPQCNAPDKLFSAKEAIDIGLELPVPKADLAQENALPASNRPVAKAKIQPVHATTQEIPAKPEVLAWNKVATAPQPPKTQLTPVTQISRTEQGEQKQPQSHPKPQPQAKATTPKSKKEPLADFSAFNFDVFSFDDIVAPEGSSLLYIKAHEAENPEPPPKKHFTAPKPAVLKATAGGARPQTKQTTDNIKKETKDTKVRAITLEAIPTSIVESATVQLTASIAASAKANEQKPPMIVTSSKAPALTVVASKKKPEEKSAKAKSDTPKKLEEIVDQQDKTDEAYIAMPVSVIVTKTTPQIQFSGSLCSFAGTVMQEDTRDNKDGDPHIGFGWANIIMEVANASSGGLQYKYRAKLEVVPGSLGLNENYFEITSQYGVLQFGNIRGPDYALIENATSLLGGTGGLDGSFFDMFNMPVGLPNMHCQAGYSKYATKLVYYTARILGFQLCLGFCPNPNHMGFASMGSKEYQVGNDSDLFSSDEMRKRMNISMGVNYEQEIDDFSIKTVLVAVREKSTMLLPITLEMPAKVYYDKYISYEVKREIPLKQDTSYHASTSLKYKNLKIAAGFINNGSINLPTKIEETNMLNKYGLHLGDCGKTWNIGGQYAIGCVDLGIAYNKARRRVTGYNNSEGQVVSFTVDCQVISGIKIFAEVDHVKAKTDDAVAAIYNTGAPAKNSGTMVMLGTKISF